MSHLDKNLHSATPLLDESPKNNVEMPQGKSPYATPQSDLDLSKTSPAPRLWNPDVVGTWSILFTPVFGSILLLKNWQAIGREDKAKAAQYWLFASICVLIASIAVLINSMVKDVPTIHVLDFVLTIDSGVISIIYLFIWYFAWQRSQTRYVKKQWGKNYQRKGWAKPLSFAVAGLAGFFIVVSVMLATVTVVDTTEEMINSLRQKRIEQLYYETYPTNVKELMVRPNIIPELINAYDKGGDDLFRFNLIVILNHRSGLSEPEKEKIMECLSRAVKDSSSWVRTEAVWGLGNSGEARMIPVIIPLLDDPEPIVVNETTLSLQKLTGKRDLPISNENMSEDERKKAIIFWKEWWMG